MLTTETLKWRRGTFVQRVAEDDGTYGPMEKTGYVSACGLWGLWRWDEKSNWCVVHIPTGKSVTVGSWLMKKLKNAKYWCGLLSAHSNEWYFSDPSSVPKSVIEAAKKARQDWDDAIEIGLIF